MKKLLVISIILPFAASPAMAADDKDKKQTEQMQTEQKSEKQDSGIVEKAVKLKVIDKVGNDGIVEKGAKLKVLTK